MGVVEKLLQEFWVQSVQYIEKVLSGRTFANWILIGEVPDQEIVPCELRPQRLHGELLVMWHFNVRDVTLFDQRLLICQDLLEEVLVDQRLGRQIELETGERYTDKSLRRW